MTPPFIPLFLITSNRRSLLRLSSTSLTLWAPLAACKLCLISGEVTLGGFGGPDGGGSGGVLYMEALDDSGGGAGGLLAKEPCRSGGGRTVIFLGGNGGVGFGGEDESEAELVDEIDFGGTSF